MSPHPLSYIQSADQGKAYADVHVCRESLAHCAVLFPSASVATTKTGHPVSGEMAKQQSRPVLPLALGSLLPTDSLSLSVSAHCQGLGPLSRVVCTDCSAGA